MSAGLSQESRLGPTRSCAGALWWVASVTVLFLAAAACAGPVTTATPDNRSGGELPLGISEDDLPRLRACIEGAGYDWEEVYPPWSSSSPPPADSLFADPAFNQAWNACLADAGIIEPFDQARIEEENRDMLAFVGCMRDRGWNLPEPMPWEGSEHPGLFDAPQINPEDIEDPESANQYFRDSADCGIPVYDENDNLLPLEQ